MSSSLSGSSEQSAKSTTSTLSHATVGSVGSGVSPNITVEVDVGDKDLRGIEDAGYESGVYELGAGPGVGVRCEFLLGSKGEASSSSRIEY